MTTTDEPTIALTLRLPASLHARVREAAAGDGIAPWVREAITMRLDAEAEADMPPEDRALMRRVREALTAPTRGS